jgi:hypothetical protein
MGDLRMMWERRSSVPQVVGLAMMVLTACASTPNRGADVPAATVAAPSISAVGASDSTESASVPTTTSTTLAPTTEKMATTTTLDPKAVAEAEIRRAVNLASESFSACLVAMPACDPATLAVARGGELLANNMARITEWNAAGYTVIDRDQFRFVIESVVVAEDNTQSTVIVCIADGSKLIRAGAGPDGADVMVDDTFVSGRDAFDMRLDPDGAWRAYAAPAVGASESSDVCPAA